mgnify:FL=1
MIGLNQLAHLKPSPQITDFWDLSAQARPGETPFLRPEEVV